MDKMMERIEREAGVPGLMSILAERLNPTDMQSILLEVYRQRSSRLTPAAILSAYETNRFVRPSRLSPAALLKWEQIAFSSLPGEFESLCLAPVCPLGTNAVVAPVDQNWSVATIRNTEVVSDSTNVLALECAVRRRSYLANDPKSTKPVHLAASHRLLRAQRYESPELLSHFSAFALCSAGRDMGNFQFELQTLGLHIRFYLASLRAFLGKGVLLQFSISNFAKYKRKGLIEAQLISPVRSEFTNVEGLFDVGRTSGSGYYRDLCFKIHAESSSNGRIELVDGGTVDWTQQYLSNAKERLVISGIGSERIIQLFGNGDKH